MDEHQKIEYLLENIMRTNIEILDSYSKTFPSHSENINDGLYIVDSGACRVQSTIKHGEKAIGGNPGPTPPCCKHFVKHLKAKKINTNEYSNVSLRKNCCDQTHNKYDGHELLKGDFFGLSDFFRIKTFNYYGDIVATAPTICLYIPKAALDNRLPVYDLEKLLDNCKGKKRVKEASLAYSTRFEELVHIFMSNSRQ